MSQPWWLVIIVALVGGSSTWVGAIITRRLNKRHDEETIVNIVVKRLEDENTRLDAALGRRDAKIEELAARLDVTEVRADKAEAALRDGQRQSIRDRELMAEMLAHVQRLEGMIPPPPPPRPWVIPPAPQDLP